MNEQQLKHHLRRSLEARELADLPGFEPTWAAAEHRYRVSRSRYRRFASAAAMAAVAATIVLSTRPTGNDLAGTYVSEQELMGSTRWLAPSDVLLPEYPFDIYRELPVLLEPYEWNEGSPL